MSNVVQVAGHVLIPHQADWMRPPQLRRTWGSHAIASLAGDEDRCSVRPEPWIHLTYDVLPYDHVERARFDYRVKAALKSGMAAVPWWGRGVGLAATAAAGATSVTLARSDHALEAGTYALIQSTTAAEYDTWDLVVLNTVSGVAVGLGSGLDYEHTVRSKVWPLLFGRPTIGGIQQLNLGRARYEVELANDARVVPVAVEDDFAGYPLGDVAGSLNDGEGWAGAWVFGEFA